MEPPKIISPPKGRVLVVAPHPDDESCGTGGTLALHRRQGDPVLVCFLTDGRGGDPDGKFGDRIADVRKAEARKAAEILGGLETEFFGFPDGCEVVESDLEMAADRLEESFDRHRPDLVYVPWREEAHTDHAKGWSVLNRLFWRLQGKGRSPLPRVLEYEVWSPLPADYIIDTTQTADLKRRAMLAHASQVAHTDYPHQLLGLSAHRSVYLPKASRYGEAFLEGNLPA